MSTDCERDRKLDVGSYVEASTDAIVTNDNTERTRSCIAGGPVGNRQGLVKYFDIKSGKILHRPTLTQLPWPADNRLIKKMRHVARRGRARSKRAAPIFSTEKERTLIGKMMTFLI